MKTPHAPYPKEQTSFLQKKPTYYTLVLTRMTSGGLPTILSYRALIWHREQNDSLNIAQIDDMTKVKHTLYLL